MKFNQTAQIPVAREPLWNFLMDVPKVAKSLPGVESVNKIDDTTYEGALVVRVGPIKLNLQGKMILEEQNKDAWRAALRAEAKDRMAAGAVNGGQEISIAVVAERVGQNAADDAARCEAVRVEFIRIRLTVGARGT